MTRSATIALAAGLLAAGGAAAQTKEVADEVSQLVKSNLARADAERAEDVEVLRRILNRGLSLPDKAVAPAAARSYLAALNLAVPAGVAPQDVAPWYVAPGSPPYRLSPNGPVDLNPAPPATVGPFDGIYLPGHGVVFTLKVPQGVGLAVPAVRQAVGLADACSKCHGSGTVSKGTLEGPPDGAGPKTEWDRTRDDIRGVRDEPKPAEAAVPVCEPGKLAERMIEKLFHNARHVRHVKADERFTVVVTYDGATREPVPPAAGPAGKLGLTPEESQQLTLGDLHLKQNKPREAADAYERGLARYPGPVFRAEVVAPQGITRAQAEEMVRELAKGVRDAYRRLAQAWLAAGDADKAAAALDMARKFKAELAAPGHPEADRGVPVPAKLIVSATQREAAAGDLAAFRKAVQVQTVGLPPADRPRSK